MANNNNFTLNGDMANEFNEMYIAEELQQEWEDYFEHHGL